MNKQSWRQGASLAEQYEPPWSMAIERTCASKLSEQTITRSIMSYFDYMHQELSASINTV